MTATDELRRLLDERGISYINVESIDGSYWGIRWFARDNISAEWRENEERNEMLAMNITPEQAIAATLGNDDVYTREDCDFGVTSDLFGPSKLRMGTCKWEPADFVTEGEWWNTECGWSFTWEPDGTPNYCPNCGAKVVDE